VRILVVDDDKAVAEVVAGVFKKRRYKVDVVHNGEEALRALEAHDYGFMVLDLKMPVMDGVAVLRQRDKFPYTTVVVLTGHSSEENAIAAIEGSVAGYYRKPLTADEIFAMIDKHIARYNVGDFMVDMTTEAAYYKGDLIPLATGLFDIFLVFMRWPYEVLDHIDIARRMVGPLGLEEKHRELVDLIKHADATQDKAEVVTHLKPQIHRLRNELDKVAGMEVLFVRKRTGFWWNPKALRPITQE
jgi:two-component system, OmpR family, response regulator